jgi:hypothetical protein
MALGRNNKEIGQVIYISENTVKARVKSVLTKLDAIGRTEAGRGFRQLGSDFRLQQSFVGDQEAYNLRCRCRRRFHDGIGTVRTMLVP